MISSRLEKLLHIPASQQGRTGLLFLFAFGMSGAYVCARADADAMFLSRVGVERLPAMILVAASAVAIISAVYSRLVAKASLRRQSHAIRRMPCATVRTRAFGDLRRQCQSHQRLSQMQTVQ